MILRRRGYAVFEAATVADALTWLADHPPQWMLLDLMLPDGCGIDVLRKIRAEHMPTRTCVITGCAAAKLVEAREAGAEHTFVKPLDVEQLVTVMDAEPG
jgi:DNA-binding response OmpR family regulator